MQHNALNDFEAFLISFLHFQIFVKFRKALEASEEVGRLVSPKNVVLIKHMFLNENLLLKIYFLHFKNY